MAIFKVAGLGLMGVNVDKDPISLENQELRQAQNAIKDPLGVESGIRKRPGFTAVNTSTAAGAVLGGIGVPLPDQGDHGTAFVYIGRGAGA